MVRRSAESSTRWVMDNLNEHEHVSSVSYITPNIIKIDRAEKPDFQAAIISSKKVESDNLLPIAESDEPVKFIANIPKEAFWTGDAIFASQVLGAAFGGLGDLYRAIRDEDDPSGYVNKEFAFFERGMRQHTRVLRFNRIHDRVYEIERSGLKNIKVMLLNEYDIVGDNVRIAVDRYGDFSDILKTNPNGQIMSSATEVSSRLGIDIHKFGEFLGRLNKP